MHFATLASKSKSKKCPAYEGESCEANKNDPAPRVALFWQTLHSGYDRALFAGAASRFVFSLPSLLPYFLLYFLASFSFFSLPLSSFSFLFSKTDSGKDVPGRQSYGWYGGHLGPIRGLRTRVKHASLLRSEASKLVS